MKEIDLDLTTLEVESFATSTRPGLGGMLPQSVLPDSIDCSSVQTCGNTNECGTDFGSCEGSCFPPDTTYCPTEWMNTCDTHTSDNRCQTHVCC